MLAFMSHSMPPPLYPQSAAPAMLPIIPCPQPAQRPKLSINTSAPRTFGKGASLRLETLSAVSPTRINTFSNAYPAQAPAQAPALEPRLSRPRLCIDSTVPDAPSAAPAPAPAPTPTSTPVAYKQPHNLVSILTNRPAAAVPRRMAAARPMFPAEKRVSFRTPLEEEITTVKYTLAHSDLEASVSTLSSLGSTVSSDASSNASSKLSLSLSPPRSDKPAPSFTSLESSPRPKQPRAGDKRDSSSSDDESDTCPETPVAGRRKRTRDWRWTLGTLPGSAKSASSTTSDATTSEDSS
jgi:hypothetical protein